MSVSNRRASKPKVGVSRLRTHSPAHAAANEAYFTKHGEWADGMGDAGKAVRGSVPPYPILTPISDKAACVSPVKPSDTQSTTTSGSDHVLWVMRAHAVQFVVAMIGAALVLFGAWKGWL